MKKSAERNGTKKQPVKGDEKRRAPIGKGKGKLAGSTVAAQALKPRPVNVLLADSSKEVGLLSSQPVNQVAKVAAESKPSAAVIRRPVAIVAPLGIAAAERKICDVKEVVEEDNGDPQLLQEYVRDIYKYLLHLECKPEYVISSDFLAAFRPKIAHYREVLIDWMMGVGRHFHLLQETLFLSVDILDRYLQLSITSKSMLQLVGTTCLWLASKYEEIYPPNSSEFINMSAGTYDIKQMLDLEIEIMQALGYKLGKPLSLHFLRRYSKVGNADTKEHNLAKYILECGLHIAEVSPICPSKKAAGALLLSRNTLKSSDDTWPSILTECSSYKPSDLFSVVESLKNATNTIHNSKHYKYTRVKYEEKRYCSVSKMKILQCL